MGTRMTKEQSRYEESLTDGQWLSMAEGGILQADNPSMSFYDCVKWQIANGNETARALAKKHLAELDRRGPDSTTRMMDAVEKMQRSFKKQR